MKKLLTALLALTLALSLAACGGKDAPSQNGGAGSSAPNAPGDGGSAPSESPEESGTPKEIDLAAFYETLRAENTWPELMNLTEDETMTELLDSYYPGLTEIPTKQCGVYVAAISAAVGELALVEVENAEDAEKVEAIFQARIDYQVGDESNPGGAWYPETIEGWQTDSRIVSSGNYIMLAVGDNADGAVEQFNALLA